MRDEELGRAILASLRDRPNPTHVGDILEICRSNGVDERYQTQRVAARLAEMGLIQEVSFSGDSLLATITNQGTTALEGGSDLGLVDYTPRPSEGRP